MASSVTTCAAEGSAVLSTESRRWGDWRESWYTASGFWNNYEDELDRQVSLKRFTTSTTLLNVDYLDEPYDVSTESFSIAGNPTHSCEPMLSGWLSSSDAKLVDMNTQVALAVPDPLGIGAFLGYPLAAGRWAWANKRREYILTQFRCSLSFCQN